MHTFDNTFLIPKKQDNRLKKKPDTLTADVRPFECAFYAARLFHKR